ncbi:DUF1036 domain-containing protein [Actinoallomurus purpureus]|uniref:DUF1036 domain-containing protein n=1 Tax=Actinoallomurus purpureus TaxID=478114 RepID=UPI002093E3EA|nr:DUF1036 domain-containing protein [Actinoallomurus purpureus]MCO6010000.1 DUF1036 domain-containing protein [Actinoallomurus purpureus]
MTATDNDLPQLPTTPLVNFGTVEDPKAVEEVEAAQGMAPPAASAETGPGLLTQPPFPDVDLEEGPLPWEIGQVAGATNDAEVLGRQVRLRNRTSSDVWAVSKYLAGGCASSNGWISRGWIRISPGGEAVIADTDNRVVYWYAYNASGTWAGSDTTIFVTSEAFRRCARDRVPGDRAVGGRKIEIPLFVNYHYVELRNS